MANGKLDYRQTPLEVNGLLLASESVITDAQWHHVGLVYDFDGLHRCLYVDGAEGQREYRTRNVERRTRKGEVKTEGRARLNRGLRPFYLRLVVGLLFET